MRLSFVAFLAVHFVASVFSWRIWPITDYPMFSKSIPSFEELNTVFVDSVYPDGNIRWTRGMFNTGNPRDLRLLRYLRSDMNLKEVDDYLLSRAQVLYHDKEAPQSLQVFKASFRVEGNHIAKTESLIREIPFKK